MSILTKIKKQEYAHPNPEELANHKNPIIKDIYEIMYKENRNCCVIVCGPPGSGKSYTANTLCSIIDPIGYNYATIRDRCINNPKDFIDKIVDKESGLKFGSAIMIDEAGTVAPAREWHSFNNKSMDYLMQVFRFRKLFVVFTVPSLELIDVHIRKFFRFYIESIGVNSKNQNVCKILQMSYSPRTGKVYNKFPRYRVNGRRRKMTKFRLDRPDIKLCNRYEEYSQMFKTEIVADLKRQSEKIEMKSVKKAIDTNDIMNKIIANKPRYVKMWNNSYRVNKGLIEADFGVGGAISLRVKSMTEKKINDNPEIRKPIELKDIQRST